MYGYSNRTALVLIAVILLIAIVWKKKNGFEFPEVQPTETPGLPRRLFWITTLAAATLASLVWLVARPGIAFQEAPYFLDRYSMYGLGQHLYRDIDYSYGPLMFYLPIVFARVTKFSLEDAFFVTWILQWFAGVAVLWKIVDIVVKATGLRHGRTIYLLLWIVTVMDVFAAGPNYTPLRYASGPLLALCSWRLFTTRESAVPACLCAAIGSVLLLFYSPEQGIALALASIVFFALNASGRRHIAIALGLFAAIVAGGLLWANSLGELAMLRAASSGAINVPIFFSAQNLTFLFALFVTGSAAWKAIRNHRSNPLLYVSLIGLACMPAAFGAANPSHMFYNLLGVLISALVVLANGTPANWHYAKTGFVVVLVLATGVEHLFMDHSAITIPARRWIVASGNRDGLLRRIYIDALGLGVGKAEMQVRLARLDADSASAAGNQPDLYGLAPGTMVMAPLGIDRPAHHEVGGLRIFTGRYPWLLPLLNDHVTEDKIRELTSHPTLPLLITDVSDGLQCRYDLRQLRQRTWQNFLPFYIPPVRHPMIAAEPLCAYINANYRRADPSADPAKPGIWLPINQAIAP